MNCLSWLGLRRRQSPLSRPVERRVYLVDASGLAENRLRGGNGQLSPRDNFFILRNLAQFAEREGIKILAVLMGRPLREADEGEQYKGVRVYYAERSEDRAKKLLQLIRKHICSWDVVLISSDVQLERQAAALKAACLRASTLRKAMEERDERGERTGDRPRGGRGGRRGERRQAERPQPAEPIPAPAEPIPAPAQQSAPEPEPQAAQSEMDRPSRDVLDLIDPV